MVLYFMTMIQYPKIGVAIYITTLLIWPSYAVVVDESGLGVNPQRIMILIASTVWISHIVLSTSYRDSLLGIIRPHQKLWWAILAFFAIGIISGTFSTFDSRQATVAALNQFLFIPISALLVLTYFHTAEEAKKVLFLLVSLALIVELAGIKEWMDQEHLLVRYVDPTNEYAAKILEGRFRGDDYRITTVFDNPLTYAQFLVFIFPIGLYFLLHGQTLLVRSISLLQVLLTPLNLAATGSRAGLALFILSVLMLGILFTKAIKNQNKIKINLVLFVIAFVILLATGIGEAIWTGENEEGLASSKARIYQLEKGIDAIQDSPLLGHGVYQALNYYKAVESTDNYYLSAATERGLAGLAIYLYFHITIIRMLKKCAPREDRTDTVILGKFFLASFFTLFAFELVLSLVEIFSFAYIALAMLFVIENSEYSKHRNRVSL